MNTSNPLTEIGPVVIAGLLIIGGVVLLFTGKIDLVVATTMFGSAVALVGGNLALKAPSPAQQSQLLQMVAQSTAQPPVVVNNNIPAQASQPIPMQPGNTYPYPAAATTGAMQPPIESLSTLTGIQAIRSNHPVEGG